MNRNLNKTIKLYFLFDLNSLEIETKAKFTKKGRRESERLFWNLQKKIRKLKLFIYLIFVSIKVRKKSLNFIFFFFFESRSFNSSSKNFVLLIRKKLLIIVDCYCFLCGSFFSIMILLCRICNFIITNKNNIFIKSNGLFYYLLLANSYLCDRKKKKNINKLF